MMIGLIQRVSRAAVTVESREVARIATDMLALIGIDELPADPNLQPIGKALLS